MEMFIAPGAEHPTKYTEIDVSPNNVRFVAEVAKPLDSWDNSTTTFFPETCTSDHPCDCKDEASGVTSKTRKFKDGYSRANQKNSWASQMSIPWATIGATEANLPIANESAIFRSNFYRIAVMNRSKLTPEGNCPEERNGACSYGAWVPTGSDSFHEAKEFGKMILEPRYGGYRCPKKSYITTDAERPESIGDCACYHGYEVSEDGNCEKRAVDPKKKDGGNKNQEPAYTCPAKSFVAKGANFPLKGFADCDCQWGTAPFPEVGECVETPQAEMYACPEKSFVKLRANYPLTNFSDCDCYVGYMKEAAQKAPEILAPERRLVEQDSVASFGDRCVPVPKPDPSSTAVALACPGKSYLSSSNWPITDVATQCTCTWGHAMDKDEKKCITKEAMQRKVAASAARKNRRCVSYKIRVVFKAGVTCAQAKKYMQIIMEALKKALGVESMFVTSSTCSAVVSRRLIDSDASGEGGMELTLGGLNEVDQQATTLPDTVSSEVVQNTLANAGVQLATQPDVQTETLNADGTTATASEDNSENSSKNSSNGISSNTVAVVGIICGAIAAVAGAIVVVSRNKQQGAAKQQELPIVGEARATADSTVDTL